MVLSSKNIVFGSRGQMVNKSILSLFIAASLYSNSAYSQQEDEGKQENREYEEVIVTAQKREQALVDVPISMSAFNEEQLEKTRAKTIEDVQALVPNFSFEKVNGFSNINIRGVGGGGRNIGFDSRSGLYIDGVYIGQASALSQPLFGIKQVEVLRGPQGHLFGRNTVSGAVSLTSATPSDEFQGLFRTVIGNYGTYEAYMTVEGSMNDAVAGRLSAAYETRDGFGVNLFDNSEIDALERKTIRGQLSFDLSEKLTLDVFADYSTTDTTKPVGEAQTGGAATGSTQFPTPPRKVNTNVSPLDNKDNGGVSFNFNYELDNDYSVTLISAYRNSKQHKLNDTDYSPLDLVNAEFFDKGNQISHELRLASPGDQRIRYMVGLYYLREDATNFRPAHVGTGFSPVPFDIAIDANLITNAYAAFTSIDADITDNLILNFGLRYTDESKNVRYSLTNGPAFGLGAADNFRDKISSSKATPTLGLTYAINEDMNMYVKYATGFKSGGFNVGFISQNSIDNGIDFKEETVDSYEFGLKGSSSDGKVSFDLAVFTATYKDFQILQFVEIGNNLTDIQLRNAARVKTNGLEGSITYNANDNLRLGLSFGLLNAEFDSFPDAAGVGVDFTGNKLPNAPKASGAATANYTFALAHGNLDWYSEYSYRQHSFSEANNNPVASFLPTRTLFNTRLTYNPNSDKWSASLWAKNLFDKEYLDLRGRDFLGNDFLSRGDPRTYGVDVTWRF